MDFGNLDRAAVKAILDTSEGFPVQSWPAAKLLKPGANPNVVPFGHAGALHVRGAAETHKKTKFASRNDQVEALWLYLHTPAGQQMLAALTPGTRFAGNKEIELNRLFPIQAKSDTRGWRVFTAQEQLHVGVTKTRCVAVLEGRERNGRGHLHVHTFYPAVTTPQLNALFA